MSDPVELREATGSIVNPAPQNA